MIRTGLALAMVVAIAAQPHRALAKGCGGGGHGGGGGGHGGGGHSHGGASSHSCVETSDIVGYRHCSRFGVWASSLVIPHLIFEFGMNVRQFTSQLPAGVGSVTHGTEAFTYRLVTPGITSHRDVAITTSVRMGVGFEHGLYVAMEGEIGGLASGPQATAEMTSSGAFGAPTVTQAHSMVLGGYGVAGIRTAALGGSFALEIAGGGRGVIYGLDSTYHDCHQTSSIGSGTFVAEARAKGEIWLSPWVTAGAMLGTSVVERGDWMAGLYLGFHTRSFAGER